MFIDILEFVCRTNEDKRDRQTGKNELFFLETKGNNKSRVLFYPL